MDEKTLTGSHEIPNGKSQTSFQMHVAGKEAQSPQTPVRERRNSHQTEIAGATVVETAKDKSEEQRRGLWFPFLATAVAFNFLLWMSMLYSIFRIDDIVTRRNSYVAISSVIFVVPLSTVLFLLWSPYPSILEKKRIEWASRVPSPHYAPAVNMINAFFCCAFVAAYLYASAIPQYHRLRWEAGVDIATVLPFPAFAFIIIKETYHPPSNDTANTDQCMLLSNQTYLACPKSAWEGTATNLESSYKAYIFNPLELPQALQSGLDFVYISLPLNLPPEVRADGGAGLIISFFDPQLDLADAFSCSMAFSLNFQSPQTVSFYVEAQRISDKLGLLQAPAYPEMCAGLYKRSLSRTSPYLAYTASLSTYSSNVTDLCGDSSNCHNQAFIQFKSSTVNSLTSVHGITKLEIVLNAGAIVGAVQFFTWFLGIFGE